MRVSWEPANRFTLVAGPVAEHDPVVLAARAVREAAVQAHAVSGAVAQDDCVVLTETCGHTVIGAIAKDNRIAFAIVVGYGKIGAIAADDRRHVSAPFSMH